MQSDYIRAIISRKSIGLMITMDGSSGTVEVSCTIEGREFRSPWAEAISDKSLRATDGARIFGNWMTEVTYLDDSQVRWLWGYEEQVDQFTTAFEEGDELV
jgi:hypothetical protein